MTDVKLVKWYTHGTEVAGVVVLKNGKAYIGVGKGSMEDYDIAYIKEWGAKLRSSDLREILASMEGTDGTEIC